MIIVVGELVSWLQSLMITTFTSGLDIFAIATLMILLATKEGIRVAGSAQANVRMRALDFIIVPFLLVFVVIIGTRFASLM